MIDLRSDTVTEPCQSMRQQMAQAPVGDDVTADDPTVNKLEAYAAELLGKPAALYVCSGVQSNLIAMMTHCQRGEEYIVGQRAHTYRYEGGGAAVLGSIQPQPLENSADGTLDLSLLQAHIKPDDIHCAQTRLICIENTFWGQPLPLDYFGQLHQLAEQYQLALHLDGARLFNAVVAQGVDVRTITDKFDSVSICLSKGLGAPVGSILVGSEGFIAQARRWRKTLGGGMRQAGIIAAGGLYALQHNIERLQQDHQHAQLLADGLQPILAPVGAVISKVATNMVFIDLPKGLGQLLAEFLAERGIRIYPSDQQRLVTHLNLTTADVEQVIQGYSAFFAR